MTKNANQHSKTTNIVIRYHFLRYEKGDIMIDYISFDMQLANIFLKLLDFNGFSFSYGELNLCIMDN